MEYPKELITMVDNMIRLHFNYEEMYEQITTCFDNVSITYDDLLNLIQDRVIEML